jgi:hypothetical protein
MFELTEFCNIYLPQYFQSKFDQFLEKADCANFRTSESIYELTGNMVGLIDILISACPEFKPSFLIEKYFLFKLRDFSTSRKKSIKEKNESRKIVHEIL